MSSEQRRSQLPENHRAVLDAVEAAGPGVHLSAQDVWQLARDRQPHIGFATVHRALIRLHDQGLVLKIDLPGAAMAYYEPAVKGHAHFRCSDCGGIADVPFAFPPRILEALAKTHDVAIDGSAVSFSGRCRSCAPAVS